MSSLYHNINNIVTFTINVVIIRHDIIISSLFSRITLKLSVHFPVASVLYNHV